MGLLIWPRMIACPYCDGSGEVEVFDSALDINPVYTEPCPCCDGTGEIKVIRATENE